MYACHYWFQWEREKRIWGKGVSETQVLLDLTVVACVTNYVNLSDFPLS